MNFNSLKIMNNKINRLLLVLFLVSGTVMVSPAQQPKAANDPLGNTGNQTSFLSTNDNTVVAPVPDGMYIFLLLASGYGVSKYFQIRKKGKIV